MTPPIIMHVNYVEQGQTIDEMFRKAVDWGFDGIELRRRRAGVQEGTEEYLDAIAKAARRSRLRLVLFGSPGPDLATDNAARRQEEVELAEDFYRLAAQHIPLTVCNLFTGSLRNPGIPGYEYDRHGSGAATDDHYQWAAEGLRHLADLASQLDFRFALETHMGYLHDLPGPTVRLLDMVGSPAVGANFDYGNMAYFKNAPSLKEAIAQLGNHIYYVHLKNSIGVAGGRFPIGLADGEINNREFLRLLKERGYSGPIGIEAPRPGDREWFAREDLAYTRALLADLGW